MEDRRRFFRIKDEMIVNYYHLKPNEWSERVREFEYGIVRQVNERQPLLGLETQIKSFIEQHREKNPDIAYVIELMNAKMNFLLSHIDMLDDSDISIQHHVAKEVSISGCGIAFASDRHIDVGEKMALELVAIPGYTYMMIYGKVIACEPAENQAFHLSIEFEHIREEDQDRLIQHILKKQAEHIKASKKKLTKKSER